MDKNQLKRLAGLPVITEKQWSGKVEAKKTPPEGLFADGTKAEICKWLKENHTDYAGAMSALNFYINRAGRNLDVKRRATLEACKDELRKAYGVKEALEPFDMQLLRRMAGLAAEPAPVVEKEEAEVDDAEAVGDAAAEGEPPEEGEDEMPAIIAKIAAKVEGKTGDELIELIQKVYDAGFKDGEEAHEEEAEGEEEVKESTDSKGKEIKAGCKIIWKDTNGEHTGTVEADPKYNGGLKVGGRSVKNIIDDSDSVMVVEDSVTEAARKPKAAEPEMSGNLTASVGVDKEDDAGWLAVELAKAGMAVDMEEAMGVFYFNFKNKADEAKARKLAEKLQIALV